VGDPLIRGHAEQAYTTYRLTFPPHGASHTRAHRSCAAPVPEGRPLSFTQQVLDDVRTQIAPEDAALKEARERRDTTRTAAEDFAGVRHSFASGSLAHGTANCPIHQRDKGLDADTGVVLDRRSHPTPERDWPSVLRELASLGPADPRWARVDDGYPFDHLVYHLHEAGRDTELHALVDGYDWMRVHLSRGGIAGLLNDYAAYPQPRPADVGIIQDALQLSANVLATQPEQLPGHLIGRMLASPDPAIRALLADIRSRDSRVGWLFPQTPYALSSPGGPLRNTLHGHTNGVRGIAVTPDGTRAVSASPDGTLRVWDLATGTTSKILADATAPLTAVAITPTAPACSPPATMRCGYGSWPLAIRWRS
jgi:WD domain, G-beta repeat/APAF-1 helical domain